VAADEEGARYVSTHCPTCEDLQVQLTEMANENSRLAEENALLRGQMGLAERAPVAGGRGVRFCHLNKRLSSNPAGRGRAQTESQVRNGRSEQLQKKHEETKSVLQRKQEEGKCLQRAQAEARISGMDQPRRR